MRKSAGLITTSKSSSISGVMKTLVNDVPKDDCAFYWSGYVPYREVE